MGEHAKDGVTVDETGGLRNGAVRAPSLNCGACYMRERNTREHDAALNSTSCPDVMEPPRQSHWREYRRGLRMSLLVEILWTGGRQASGCGKREKMTAK